MKTATTFLNNETDPLLLGIIHNDPQVLRQLYRVHLPTVVRHVRKNKGSSDEAKDVFQDAILIIYEKAQQPDFVLQEGLGNYLFGVCRFLWLRQLKKKQREPITNVDGNAHTDSTDWENIRQQEEQEALFKELFAKLGVDCQKVLQRFFDGQKLSDIALELGYTKSYIKLKKFQCKERLTKWIKADKRYQELRKT